MIAENEPSGGGVESGNIFNVRSNNDGYLIWFDTMKTNVDQEGHVVVGRHEALLLAAWLVSIAGGDRRDFEDLLRAIRKS